MVIRVEAITPDQEQLDIKEASGFGGGDEAPIRAYFLGLGRFAEPRLRNALTKLKGGATSASDFLATLAGVDVDLRVGE